MSVALLMSKPYTNAELVEIRTKLEDGDIPGVEKYMVLQRLIQSHLLANGIADENHDHGLRFANVLDDIIDILDDAGMVSREMDDE